MTPIGVLNTTKGGTNMKKVLLPIVMLAMACAVTAGIAFFPGETVKAAGDVEINETNFPNSVFRNIVQEKFDSDSDGKLSADEIKKAKDLSLDSKGINDLTGIGFLSELENLNIFQGDFENLDLNKNVKLTSVSINSVSYLDNINISGCKELSSLIIRYTSIANIDLSNNMMLKNLNLSSNPLQKLDLSDHSELETLNCSWSNEIYGDPIYYLNSIDLSNCTSLKELDCSFGSLKKLDLKDCHKLKVLKCSWNGLKELDIGACPVIAKTYLIGTKDYNTDYFDDYDLFVNYTLRDNDSDDKNYLGFLELDPSVKINYKSDELNLNKNEAVVECGKSLTLKAAVKDDSKNLTWISSDESIAAVDNNGKVKTKKAGTVSILAETEDSTDRCIITVLYKDVKNSKDFWFKPTNYLTAAGVVKGYDKQTKFKPGNDCTRAQMVTFLYRLQGEPYIKTSTCKFNDVKKTDYFFKPVIWAVEKGITTGVSKTKFDPQGVCTRAQTVTFLWRMADKPEPDSKTCKFSDVKEKDYFYKPVIWASEKKIVAGYKDGTFKPQGKCLRRQMVTFLYKYDKFINGKG